MPAMLVPEKYLLYPNEAMLVRYKLPFAHTMTIPLTMAIH